MVIKLVVAIVGPTGVGKTKLSEELASRYNGIIINCDAVQIYKELNIGSAKPKKDEMKNVPHYLFDLKKITEDYTVKDYQIDLRKILDNNKDKNIFIVGGTGLYLKAGLYNYVFSRDNGEDYDSLSNEKLYDLALKKDKNCDIHPHNRIRLIRFLKSNKTVKDDNKLLYDTIFIGLSLDRKLLYERINKRVDLMIKEGLIKEVKSLKDQKSRVLGSAIGYKEILSYLDNQISLEDAIDLIKKNSRHYAKKQYTWFNNKMDVNWFNVDLNDFDKTIEEIDKYISNY